MNEINVGELTKLEIGRYIGSPSLYEANLVTTKVIAVYTVEVNNDKLEDFLDRTIRIRVFMMALGVSYLQALKAAWLSLPRYHKHTFVGPYVQLV